MRSNKKRLSGACLALLLIIFCLFNKELRAQQILGVFISGSDFNVNKLSLAKTNDKKCKINLHNFSYKPFVSIKYGDSSYVFLKDSIFGYKDNSGDSYRFFRKNIYPVLNQGEQILLYKIETNEGTPKNPIKSVEYYFSKDANSIVLPLTTDNLEKVFNGNKIFKEFLEVHFKSDADLIEYDNSHKIYKINRLLELSLK